MCISLIAKFVTIKVNMKTKLTASKLLLAAKLAEVLGPIVTRKEVIAYIEATGIEFSEVRWIFNNKKLRAGRARYDLSSFFDPGDEQPEPAETEPGPAEEDTTETGSETGPETGPETLATLTMTPPLLALEVRTV